MARVKSQLRRYTSLGGKQGGGEANPALLTNGGIALDDGAKSVTVDGEGVSLHPHQYEHPSPADEEPRPGVLHQPDL